MKLAFSSNAFTRFTLVEAIEILSGIGYRGMEIMCDVPHAYPPHLSEEDIREIGDALEAHKMEISNLNAFPLVAIGTIHHPSWLERDEVERQKRVQHTLNCIQLAKRLGAKNISTEPGGPMEELTPPAALDRFVQGLDQVAAEAIRNEVKVLVEPEPGLFIETSHEFLNLIGELDTEAFGLNFDIGHFFCAHESPSEQIRRLRDYIGHIHLEDIAGTRKHFHMVPGDGAIEFAPIFEAIQEIGYDGFIAVELYPHQEKAIEVAKRSFDFIQDLAADLFK
jgi:sugar phosphate isomerase/epimerase